MEAEDFAVMQDPGRRKRLVFRILGVILGLGALVAVFLTATHWFKIHGEAKEAKKASLALKFNTNLDEIDPLCGDLDYIVREPREMNAKTIMTNNFAFGGINTSIILKHT